MKIKFQRTGGFANIPVNIELDSANLNQELLDKLQNLLANINLFNSDKPVASPDMHTYELTVENEGQVQSLHATDATLTDALQDVFDFVMENC